MNRAVVVTIGTALASLLLAVAPASAEEAVLDDVSGDAAGAGPDIVRVTVRNLEHAVVAKVELVEQRRGSVVVSVDPRGANGVRMVSQRRPGRPARNMVLPYAFTDRHPVVPPPECTGFRFRWNDAGDTVVMRLPSRCLDAGDSDEVRVGVLTENGNGDADWAPETRRGHVGVSAWVPRG